ncbi:MAG: hypothetical protein ALAOOOJD_02284 [bacterium]|nr:hypothetical protein [bacterium]
MQLVFFLLDDIGGAFGGIEHNPLDFFVDHLRRALAVVAMFGDFAAQKDFFLFFAECERPHQVAHAPLAYHFARQFGRAFDVVAGAGGRFFEHQFLGFAPAHQMRQERVAIIARVIVLLINGQRRRQAQRAPARNDGDFVHRIRAGRKLRHQRMPGFVIGGDALFIFADQHAAALGAHQHFVLGLFQIAHRDAIFAVTRRQQRGLIDHAGDVGARKTRRAFGQHVQIDVFGNRDFFGVHFENAFAAAHIRTIHDDLAVKPPRSQQRGIQHIRPVCRRDENHPLIRIEAVHLDKQLIQRLLTLIVAAAQAGTAMPANRVNFVDENDAGRIFFALLEKIPHARSADADKHFDKIRAGHAEKRHPGFTGHRFREQRLARSRRAKQQRALRDFSAEPLEFFRIAQKFDDLAQFLLGLIRAGDVIERDFRAVFGEHFRARFAE